MDPAQAVAARLESVFGAIHRERMCGLPILNPRLRVQVVGLRPWAGGWLGVLVTPWTMNLIALPADDLSGEALGQVGSKRIRAFPSGDYEFLAGDPAGLGPHETCSLFSPMHEFADQEAAVAAALEVLKTLMEQSAALAQPAPALERPVSRRGLFRALAGPGTSLGDAP
jgi:[NiFe] hydrogenase assembly HybE family chaperone